MLPACNPTPPPPAPTPAASPSPTPVPSPTPTPTPFVPRKPMETGMIFNGLQYNWKVETSPGDTAARDREEDDAYRLELNLKIRTPRPATTLEDVKVANPRLPQLLPSLPSLLETAQVSPDFAKLYDLKLDWLKERLEKIDQILSRHNFYDCDTILKLKDPQTGRRALFVQGDMDVNVDGSDGDRNIEVDGSGQFFQPQTSYRWPKVTDRPNPFLKKYETRIVEAEAEMAKPETTEARRAQLRERVAASKLMINDLKASSFLVSKADPNIVLPGFMMRGEGADVPKVGDYAVVIHEDKMYPVILGDAGPSYKVGEASLRLCNEIKDTGTPLARPVSDLAVTYLVFPGSRDEKRSAPDLDKWHARCTELLAEIGVPDAPLHRWENIVPPWPEEVPAASPEASPAADASPSVSPGI
jgi:Fungal chitosanase of glycosyl hydrolase group 75